MLLRIFLRMILRIFPGTFLRISLMMILRTFLKIFVRLLLTIFRRLFMRILWRIFVRILLRILQRMIFLRKKVLSRQCLIKGYFIFPFVEINKSNFLSGNCLYCAHMKGPRSRLWCPLFQFSSACHRLTSFDHCFDCNIHTWIQLFDALYLMTSIITTEISFRVVESEKSFIISMEIQFLF